MEQDKLFARVNDAIRQLAGAEDVGTETWEFFCECPDLACSVLVGLTAGEFDERRASLPPLPILAAEHPVAAS